VKIREELILKALAGEETKVELVAKYGVSRKTLYKWLDRYKERGLAGLVDESRRPHSSPMVTSPELALAAMQLRKAHPSWGPKKVVAVLARQYPGESIPSVSTTMFVTPRSPSEWSDRPYPRSDGPPPPRSGWPPPSPIRLAASTPDPLARPLTC